MLGHVVHLHRNSLTAPPPPIPILYFHGLTYDLDHSITMPDLIFQYLLPTSLLLHSIIYFYLYAALHRQNFTVVFSFHCLLILYDMVLF